MNQTLGAEKSYFTEDHFYDLVGRKICKDNSHMTAMPIVKCDLFSDCYKNYKFPVQDKGNRMWHVELAEDPELTAPTGYLSVQCPDIRDREECVEVDEEIKKLLPEMFSCLSTERPLKWLNKEVENAIQGWTKPRPSEMVVLCKWVRERARMAIQAIDSAENSHWAKVHLTDIITKVERAAFLSDI